MGESIRELYRDRDNRGRQGERRVTQPDGVRRSKVEWEAGRGGGSSNGARCGWLGVTVAPKGGETM